MNLVPGVTAVIPTIPTRRYYLERAVRSVLNQTHPVDAISVALDKDHEGAALTRNRALESVGTEWCAFLDDDDEWLPEHVESLLGAADETGADVVYPWFLVPDGFDVLAAKGLPFDRNELRLRNYIPVTVLARTKLLRAVGGFTSRGDDENPCEDWGCWLKLVEAGASFHHLNQRTWVWNWHGKNTSGRGDRW
jgi:glycosyltransferase involved in cell wall biosynthesis